MLETTGVDAIDALVSKEAVLPTPNPAKDDPPLVEKSAPAEAAGIADKDGVAVAGAVEAVEPKVVTEDGRVVPLVAGVDPVVVVTVRNSGADAVVHEKEPGGFEAGVLETAEADEGEDEAALENP